MTKILLAVFFSIVTVTHLLGQESRKLRLLVTDSESWQVTGAVVQNEESATGGSSGGARPQTAEIFKTVMNECPQVIATSNQERADYVLLLEHEGGKSIINRDNKFVLFDSQGDALRSGSTRSLGNAVKDACAILLADWGSMPESVD